MLNVCDLFVYGSLRSDISDSMHTLLHDACVYQSDGYFHGKLYHIGDYPGAVTSDDPTQKVYGQIFQIANPKLLFKCLDHYEECSPEFSKPYEFVRTQVDVIAPGNKTKRCWCYLYNHDTTPHAQIHSGDYRRFRA